MNEDHEAIGRTAVAARVAAALMLLLVPVVLVASRPLEVQVSVEDARGRPVEAVPVRVVRRGGYASTVRFTDIEGRVRFAVGGIDKHIDVVVADSAAAAPPYACPEPAQDGLNYAAVSICDLDASVRAVAADLRVVLESHTGTAQVCRLTGRGAATRPYDYEGQDSAITIPVFGRPGATRHEDVLWWFGDTTTDATREVYVSNKMAVSDPEADPAGCPALDYIDLFSRGPLAIDPARPGEATVWLDVPLVDHASRSRGVGLANGRFGFDPDAGDTLFVAYLSVADTQPFFKITEIGLSRLSACYPDCDHERAEERMLTRVPGATWDLPVEYGRAPEGTSFLFDDAYTIVKVAPRRSYCANDPDVLDCDTGAACPDQGQCILPGRFCSESPHVVCGNDASCEAGKCEPGGVIAMRVPASSILDKTSYRYWNARTRRFDKARGLDSDAFLQDALIGNSASVMWSAYLRRWLMIHTFEGAFFQGMKRVGLRTSPDLFGPWSEAVTIMENVGDQKSYNPRFVPDYERGPLVYWTATFDTFGANEPMHAAPFDYNVFLYETDLTRVALP